MPVGSFSVLSLSYAERSLVACSWSSSAYAEAITASA